MESWQEFTAETSLHGVKYIFKKTGFVRRSVWLVLTLGTLVYFVYASQIFLTDYTKKITTTKIKVSKAKQLNFPTVTICNKNIWKRSIVEQISTGLQTDGLETVLSDLYFNKLPPPADKYDWNSPRFATIGNLLPEDTEEFLKISSHTLDETLRMCTIKGRTFSCEDVMEVVNTDAGWCFQFNSNGSISTSSAGQSSGIVFLLDARVDEYFVGPNSYSEGFFVALHEANEPPQVRELSIGLAPGTETWLSLQKSEISRVPPPADDGKADCFDAKNMPSPLHYYNTYSYSGCQIECETRYVLNRCGCRDPLQPPLNGSQICDIKLMLNCSEPAKRKFPSDEEGLSACDCPDPCNEVSYTAKISTFSFPSTQYLISTGTNSDTASKVKANQALLVIYYGKMSYESIEESVQYTILDVIANLGGTIGVSLGASLLTFCEFFDYLFMWMIHMALSKTKRATKPEFEKKSAFVTKQQSNETKINPLETL